MEMRKLKEENKKVERRERNKEDTNKEVYI